VFKIQLIPELSSLEISVLLSLLLKLVVDKSLIHQYKFLMEDMTGCVATVNGVAWWAETVKDATCCTETVEDAIEIVDDVSSRTETVEDATSWWRL